MTLRCREGFFEVMGRSAFCEAGILTFWVESVELMGIAYAQFWCDSFIILILLLADFYCCLCSHLYSDRSLLLLHPAV